MLERAGSMCAVMGVAMRTSRSYASISLASSDEEGTVGALGAVGVWNSLTWPTWAFADWIAQSEVIGRVRCGAEKLL